MTYGTLIVDFAGTRDEAWQFVAATKTLRAGNHPNHGNEDLPVLTAIYTSDVKRRAALDELARLGWPGEAVLDRPYRYAPRRVVVAR